MRSHARGAGVAAEVISAARVVRLAGSGRLASATAAATVTKVAPPELAAPGYGSADCPAYQRCSDDGYSFDGSGSQ
jgi:hypothetical protein